MMKIVKTIHLDNVEDNDLVNDDDDNKQNLVLRSAGSGGLFSSPLWSGHWKMSSQLRIFLNITFGCNHFHEHDCSKIFFSVIDMNAPPAIAKPTGAFSSQSLSPSKLGIALF